MIRQLLAFLTQGSLLIQLRSSRLALLASIFIGLGTTGLAHSFPRLPVYDIHGDCLPAGASARLGTVKLRAGSAFITASADGTSLIGLDGPLVRKWDAADGKLLSSRRLIDRPDVQSVGSEDGRTIVVKQESTLEIWDTATHTRLDLPVPKERKRIDEVAISNDRRWILFTDVVDWREPPGIRGGFRIKQPVLQLVLWDTKSGTARVFADEESGIVWLGFSADGKQVVSTGGHFTKLWDTVSGKCVWSVPNYNAEQTHFTPDGKHLIAAPGGGQNEWHIWEAATGEPAKGLKPPAAGYVWMFAISPDGTKLARPTETDYELWDLLTGKLLHRWPGANQGGRVLFASDGKSLIAHDTIFHCWDIATGKAMYAEVNSLGHSSAVYKIMFTADGKRLISIGGDQTARVWEVERSKLLRTIPLIGRTIDVWLLAPDGKSLIGLDEKLFVHRWDLETAKYLGGIELKEATELQIGLRARDARLAMDGSLVVLGWPRLPEYRLVRFSFSRWNLATGKLVRWGESPGDTYQGDESRLAPDGSFAAVRDGLFDTTTAVRRVLPVSPIGAGGTPVFSPDGRLVASCGGGGRIWELATGRVLRDLPRGSGTHERAAFSPDGRRFACMSRDRMVVWDVNSGRSLVEWPDPHTINPGATWILCGFGFSPDGKTFATGQIDGTVLLRQIPEASEDDRWTATDGESLWKDLADESPSNAYSAVWQLAHQPKKVMKLFGEKYPLAPATPPDEWKKLIAQLDSPRFQVREVATKRIAQLGRAGFGPLRSALKNQPSTEQARRIESLLAQLAPKDFLPQGEDLRAVRAVAVLEMCGSKEARQLLQAWSERGAFPRLADEAAKALWRSIQP